MEYLHFLIGITAIFILLAISNYFLNTIEKRYTSYKHIPHQELQILHQINKKLTLAAYISNHTDLLIIKDMLTAFLGPYYPTSGIFQPYQTWLILARKYYSKHPHLNSTADNTPNPEITHQVNKLLRETLVMSSDLQTNEVMPFKLHIWLVSWLGILNFN